MLDYYTLDNVRKPKVLTFLRGMEIEHWAKMGYVPKSAWVPVQKIYHFNQIKKESGWSDQQIQPNIFF